MAYWRKKYRYLVRNVAMVVVAAIALESSTYTCFVSNNIVKAATTTIAAQSNDTFMVIDKDVTTTNSGIEVILISAVCISKWKKVGR